jgi:hypothetical protein
MADQTNVTTIVARLVQETRRGIPWTERHPRAQVYRPLIVSAAIMRRPSQPGDPWRVTLQAEGVVRPRVPGSWRAILTQVASLREAGVRCRLAAALVAPEDIARSVESDDLPPQCRTRCRCEFYGWALLYHPPGTPRIGLVEPHTDFEDLPAFFKSPLELLDRSMVLAARGIHSRPLALFTQPEDFYRAADGTFVNRFFPESTMRRPRRLGWLS